MATREVTVKKMRKFWSIAVIVYLLYKLAGGFVIAEQSLLNWEDEMGMDMCPECRPIPRSIPTVPHGSLSEKDLGVDMQSLLNWEDEMGVDMCPECRSLPPPPSIPTVPHGNLCEDLGVDMFPEKGQPMAVAENHRVRPTATDLVKELQQLVKAQEFQINQLANLVQQLGEIHSSVDLERTDLFNEQAPRRADSIVGVIDDVILEHQPIEDALPLDLTKTRQQQNLLESTSEENSASPQADGGVVPTGLDSLGSGAMGITVARYKPSWSEHFSFLSAVKVNGEVSCLHLLPPKEDDGVSRYVVVGDMTGQLYIFLWLGDLHLYYPTISTSPITSMLSYTLQKNEIIFVTGHADGGVLVHKIWEIIEQGSFSKDSSYKLSSVEPLHILVPPSPLSLRVSVDNSNEVGRGDGKDDSESETEAGVSIVNLEMYKVGKMRYTLVGDMSGKIQLFRDNGSLHGIAQSPSQPMTFMKSPSQQRLVFLTGVGVGSLDLRSMQVRSSLCEGLNTSIVTAYAFDVIGRSKANGFSTEGDLLSVVVTGDILHFECHVKKRQKVEISGPFVPQALKGYLVTATPDHVVVFNTTLQTGLSYASFWTAGPKPLFSVTMNEIALSFLKTPISRSHRPVMASNRDKLMVVGFGDGYVGVFRSNLPTTRTAEFGAKFWSGSILISAVALLVLWQLFSRKRDPGSASSTEYPSAYEKVEGARLGFGQREKAVEQRRFKSPTRGYVAVKSDSRSFLSSGVDTGTYSSRREPLFASNQPVGDRELRQ